MAIIWDNHCFDRIVQQVPRRDFPRIVRQLRHLGVTPVVTPINLLEAVAIPDERQAWRSRLLQGISSLSNPLLLCSPEAILRSELANALNEPRWHVFRERPHLANMNQAATIMACLRTGRPGIISNLLPQVNRKRIQAANRAVHAAVAFGVGDVGSPAAMPEDPHNHAAWTQYWEGAAERLRASGGARDIDSIVPRAVAWFHQFILASGETPYSGDLHDMWMEVGASTVSQRITFLSSHWPRTGQSPVIKHLTLMYAHQAVHKYDRGNFMDLLQASYLPMGHTLYTCDAGLLEVAHTSAPLRERSAARDFGRVLDALGLSRAH